MGLKTVSQNLGFVFEENRRGKSIILNPKTLKITIEGHHNSDVTEDENGKLHGYSKWEGSNFQLAQKMIKGSYVGGTPRPFMYALMEKFKEEESRFLQSAPRYNYINKAMTYDRSAKGFWVDWDSICQEMESSAMVYMYSVSREMPPVTTDTQKKKSRMGYGNRTLVASGQLVEAIVVRAR